MSENIHDSAKKNFLCKPHFAVVRAIFYERCGDGDHKSIKINILFHLFGRVPKQKFVKMVEKQYECKLSVALHIELVERFGVWICK